MLSFKKEVTWSLWKTVFTMREMCLPAIVMGQPILCPDSCALMRARAWRSVVRGRGTGDETTVGMVVGMAEAVPLLDGAPWTGRAESLLDPVRGAGLQGGWVVWGGRSGAWTRAWCRRRAWVLRMPLRGRLRGEWAGARDVREEVGWCVGGQDVVVAEDPERPGAGRVGEEVDSPVQRVGFSPWTGGGGGVVAAGRELFLMVLRAADVTIWGH